METEVNKVGRPLKFQSVEEIRGGDSIVEICGDIACNVFAKESDLEQYIIEHIDRFMTTVFNDELIYFESNKPIDVQHFSPRGRRVDLFVQCKNFLYLIELKNPNSGTESRAAIGQILDYGKEFLDPKKQLVIITTKFDHNTAETIKYYNLPIRYIFMDKERSLEYFSSKND